MSRILELAEWLCCSLIQPKLNAMTAELFPDGLPPIPDLEGLRLGPWLLREDNEAVRLNIFGRLKPTGPWLWSRATLSLSELEHFQKDYDEDFQRLFPVILREKIEAAWQAMADLVEGEIAKREVDVDASHEPSEAQQGGDCA